MKKAFLISLFLFLGLFICTSYAVEVNLFGPQKYLQTKGKPNIYTGTFPGRTGVGILKVMNGDANGKNRISSAIVRINGVEILGPNDFNQNVYNLEIPVSLEENNMISVELRSKPNSYLTIKIVQDIEPEASEIIGPEGGVIEVTCSDSPLYGCKIEIPSGAVSENILIQILRELNPPEITEPNYIHQVPIVNFTTSLGRYTFSEAVNITIPLDGFNLDDLMIPIVFYYNAGLNEWEFVPFSYNFEDNTVIFRTDHFSLFAIGLILLNQEIYDYITQVNEVHEKVWELADEIIRGTMCSVLRFYLNYFEDVNNDSWSRATDIAAQYGYCGYPLLCGGEYLNEWLREHIIEGFAFEGSRAILNLLHITKFAKAVGAAGGVAALIATPCLACYLRGTTINPEFYMYYIRFIVSQIGISLVEKEMELLHCSGILPFEENWNDGVIDPADWVFVDNVISSHGGHKASVVNRELFINAYNDWTQGCGIILKHGYGYDTKLTVKFRIHRVLVHNQFQTIIHFHDSAALNSNGYYIGNHLFSLGAGNNNIRDLFVWDKNLNKHPLGYYIPDQDYIMEVVFTNSETRISANGYTVILPEAFPKYHIHFGGHVEDSYFDDLRIERR